MWGPISRFSASFIPIQNLLNSSNYIKTALCLFLTLTSSCSRLTKYMPNSNVSFVDEFDSEEHFNSLWVDASQRSPKSYTLENDNLKITTRAYSTDRVKVKTKNKKLSVGSYQWRIFIPEMKLNERCSIGAFLYNDDQHELDFEIGSGILSHRKQMNAQSTDLLLYCTAQSQANNSTIVLVKSNSWVNLKLVLSKGENSFYNVKWFLNDKLIKQAQLNYGNSFKYSAYCSLENIPFIGESIPTQDNYTLFDEFEYKSLEF